MTTGHFNPGYRNIVSSFNVRAKSAPGASLYRDGARLNADQFDLDRIRQNARNMWSGQGDKVTSYEDHYMDRTEGSLMVRSSRPTSSNRRNKPHPPLVFLATRLHNCPGYHNPDATLGKPAYKVDASLPADQREQRTVLRSKYIGRPRTAAIMQYDGHEELEGIDDPIERQGTEAALRVMHDEDKNHLLDRLRVEQAQKDEYMVHYENDTPKSAEIVPSLHRYGKTAGAEEYYRLANLNYRTRGQLLHPKERLDIISRRFNDIDKTKQSKYVHHSKRGDFLMHPEWKPSIPHHRLNGLSSLDIPYYPGRR